MSAKSPRTYVESLEQRLAAMEALLKMLAVSPGVDTGGIDLGALLERNDDDEKTLALQEAAATLGARAAGVPPNSSTPSSPLDSSSARNAVPSEFTLHKVPS